MSRYTPSHKLTNEEWENLRDPLNVGDVANILHKSRRWVQEYAKAGRIPHHRVGHDYWFSKAEIFKFAGIKDTTGIAPEVRVKLDVGAYPLVRAHATDAGADIRTPRSVTIPAGGCAIVDTGVHVELPHGTVGMLKSKSGLNVRHGIVGEGVIDEGYDGAIVVKVYNHGAQPVRLERGDKLIQLVVMPVLYPTFAEVDEIEGGERGSAGFGSTGA